MLTATDAAPGKAPVEVPAVLEAAASELIVKLPVLSETTVLGHVPPANLSDTASFANVVVPLLEEFTISNVRDPLR